MAGNFESVKKIVQLPIVEAMLNGSSAVYDRIKNSNSVFNWTLSLTESTVQKALQVAGVVAPIPGPVAKKLDQVLVDGISFFEEKLPIVKKAPQQIYQEAKDYLSSSSQKLQNYKEKMFSFAKDSVDQTKTNIISLGNAVTKPLRDSAQATEKFVDEKLKPKATELATAVATAPEQVLGAVSKLSGDITCGTCLKEMASASPTVPAVTVTPPTSAVVKAT